MENLLALPTINFCRQGVFWFKWLKCNLFGDPLYLPMEEEEGLSPAVLLWGVLCSLICSISAALIEGCQAQTALAGSLESVKGNLMSQRRMRRNEGQGTAKEGTSVKSLGFVRGWGESLEHQKGAADGPVLLKLKMRDCFRKSTWQKTGIIFIDKHIQISLKDFFKYFLV